MSADETFTHSSEIKRVGKSIGVTKSADDRQVGGTHYKTMQVQPWEAMEAWLTREEFIGFLKGNVIKYMARSRSGKEPHDICVGKAGHYQQKLDEVLSRNQAQAAGQVNQSTGSISGGYDRIEGSQIHTANVGAGYPPAQRS